MPLGRDVWAVPWSSMWFETLCACLLLTCGDDLLQERSIGYTGSYRPMGSEEPSSVRRRHRSNCAWACYCPHRHLEAALD
ncbi:hypothetical protein GY45DRAFT_278364 [Cubamyces sp. BRFM 1775]|nr:hypothetical protein GY45DRAFT_278364 [Cubamyces sp. BRFM 1775]